MVADTSDLEYPPKLRPDMASLRLIILKFIREYIGKWGASPSYGEIAYGCDTNRTKVKRAIRSLAKDKLILHVRGPRGISLPDDEQAAIEQLRRMGYHVDESDQLAVRRNGTKTTLLPPPELDYVPDDQDGADRHETQEWQDEDHRRTG